MLKQGLSHGGTASHRRFRRKILGCNGTGQSHEAQQNQDAAHLQYIAAVPVRDTRINNMGHHQRHQQLKAGFQKLEKRS